ncbi:GNAT family N-acetyltransferase [Streptococcus gallolyticus]|uniref:GNAT family N-acetyltransferase n=1 Tax=Streptococcus hepaticus TaxID=3349163 RepID=UPI001C98619D|nr:GNAT family N-acetyltransferase [Streptococcus gallolyticus]MBY5041166.1 GNAT family N-acetyltransferase [Streptococcus gallolyticus]
MVRTIGIRKAYETEFARCSAEKESYLTGLGLSEAATNAYMGQIFHLPSQESPEFTVMLLNNELAGCMFLPDSEGSVLAIQHFLVFTEARNQGLEQFYLDYAVEEARELGKEWLAFKVLSKDSYLLQLALATGFEIHADREIETQSGQIGLELELRKKV